MVFFDAGNDEDSLETMKGVLPAFSLNTRQNLKRISGDETG
jgi:hypothetical protein